MQDPFSFPPIKIKYEPLSGYTVTYWPLVKIYLTSKSVSLPQPIYALVDSGSNISILRPDIAEFLGHPRSFLKFVTPGSSVSGTYKAAALSDQIVTSLYGYKFEVQYTVVDNPHLAFPCILGEDSIFHWARLDFQKYKGYFEIRFRQDLN